MTDRGRWPIRSYLFLTYFLVLFSYPLIRSVATTIFYEHYSSNEFAFATGLTVFALTLTVWMLSGLQKRIGMHRLYALIGISTAGMIIGSKVLLDLGYAPFAYVIFAVKEIYIVLMVHLFLAFCNNYFTLEEIKKLYGPLGAVASVGGILGGALTAIVAKKFGTDVVLYTAALVIAMAILPFLLTTPAASPADNYADKRAPSPLKSIRGIVPYVALVASMVALTQFIIFIADLQFNIVFESAITEKDARTEYLGKLYSLINVVTLLVQALLIKFLYGRLTNHQIMFGLPFLYLGFILTSVSLGGNLILVASSLFIMLKAMDYSVYTVAKEILYFPLSAHQKYGSKYITDIWGYRVAKGILALTISTMSIKSLVTLSVLQCVFISMWVVVIYFIFKEQRKIINSGDGI